MTAVVVRGDARDLPLPDASVDLIVTSPPYWSLRSYTDGGEHYQGQIGSEATHGEYIDTLIDCTREWVRVLKPTGSLWINLGDKYASDGRGPDGSSSGLTNGPQLRPALARASAAGVPRKSLIGLPWRYALACIDELGLILRAEVIWSKPNGLPESVTDRVRRSHEQWFHFTRQPRYYSCVDEIREPSDPRNVRPQDLRGEQSGKDAARRANGHGVVGHPGKALAFNPLGKMPGSVWEIASEPLKVPADLGVDHFAAFPTEWPRRIIAGWSPPGICVECGEGRCPAVDVQQVPYQSATTSGRTKRQDMAVHSGGWNGAGYRYTKRLTTITGYVCACTPYTDHPERHGRDFHASTDRASRGRNDGNGGERYRRYVEELANPRGPVREYGFDQWEPAPTRPSVVLDPFGGTGTTALVASVLGRVGITVDRSLDYCRLAQWRTSDPRQRAKALRVPAPPQQVAGQLDLLGEAL